MPLPAGSWSCYEVDQDFVTESYKKGHFDFLEGVARVNETEFFRYLLTEGQLRRLAETYPTPRKKQEVPLWIYVASQVSMKIHAGRGFAAYPHILPLGGLRDALGPGQIERKEDPDTGERRDVYAGFNEKNSYERTTPVHHDTLRKLAKDTDPERLERWFGTEVPRLYKELGAYDEEGIFVIDGSYLFVPDNERYEESSRLRFDEGGHPLSKDDYEALTPKEREQTQWRRCYRKVSLLHADRAGERFLYCGANVMPGRNAEVPRMGALVDRFVEAVGRGVLKTLLIDRGFIDGPTIGRFKVEQGIDVVVPLKKNMLDLIDARTLAEVDGAPWQVWRPPVHVLPPIPPQRPEDIQRAEEKRQKTVAEKKAELPAPVVVERVELKAVRGMRLWDSCPVPVHVVLLREFQSDGSVSEWALATTKDFEDPLEIWKLYGLRASSIEERHRQTKLFWKLTNFSSQAFSMITSHVVFTLLAYSLLQVYLLKNGREDLAPRTRERVLEELSSDDRVVAVYYQNRVAYYPQDDFTLMTLRLREGARRRAIGTVEQQVARRKEASELPMPP